MVENLIFIGLGSNLGNRQEALRLAIESLQPEILPLASSHVYETPPWGYADQPAFLNQVIKAQTNLSPFATLKKLKQIEKDLGRKPNFRYGPRNIDLDILFYNDEIIETEQLTIPHPELIRRAFVLIPLLDIAPDMLHPVEKLSIKKLSEKIDSKNIQPIKP